MKFLEQYHTLMGILYESELAPTLTAINQAIQKRETCFDIGHGATHHYAVMQDAWRIISEENFEMEVNLDMLLVAASVHDFIQRGYIDDGHSQHLQVQDLRQLLEQIPFPPYLLNQRPPFIEDVISTISTHQLDGEPESIEQMVLWAADKINYVSLPRFIEAKGWIDSEQDPDRKRHRIEALKSKYKDQWVEGATDKIPNSEIFSRFPSAKTLFETRLRETLEYIRREGADVFGSWARAYDEAVS